MSQIALPFDWPAPEDSDAFIVTSANRQAVDGIDRPGSWPVRAAILTGPRKSGRSLLGRIFAAKTGGTLIDDAEQHREAEIFHRWNEAQEARRPLLIVAMSAPPIWKVKLPDLASRLSATPIFTLGEPDDVLVAMLLEKLLGQRGLQPGPGVINYIATRIERSYIALMRVIDALDSAALSQHRAVTNKLARVVLHDLHMTEERDNIA
ncbi:MAG: chromosomal replication initiator DnaA [Pseudomonadota bacterium]